MAIVLQNVVLRCKENRLRNYQDLWIGVLRGVRLDVRLVGSFDLFAVGEGDVRRGPGLPGGVR